MLEQKPFSACLLLWGNLRNINEIKRYCKENKCDLYDYVVKNEGEEINEFLNEQSIKSVDLNTLSTISQSDILDFLYFTMNIRANSAASRARKLSSLRGFFKYMVQKTHQLEINPCENIELPQNKKRLPKYLTLEQCMELLSNIDSKFASRDYCIVMFSDLTKKVTMQNLFHDGGFSSMGMSLRAMTAYERGLEDYMDENGKIQYG